MRKSLLTLVALAPLVALAGLALPAVAESEGGACAGQTAVAPLNLDAIPAKPVAGRLAVKGAGEDCDEESAIGTDSAGVKRVSAETGERSARDGLGDTDD